MSTFYDGTIKLLTFVRPDPLHPSQDSKNSILIIFLFLGPLLQCPEAEMIYYQCTSE